MKNALLTVSAAATLIAASLIASPLTAHAAVQDCTWGNCLWRDIQYSGYMAVYGTQSQSSFYAFNNQASSLRVMQTGIYRFTSGQGCQGSPLDKAYGDSIGDLRNYGLNDTLESYCRIA